MTLKEIQQQYGDGVWLLISKATWISGISVAVLFDNDTIHEDAPILGAASYGWGNTQNSSDFIVLDVEEKEELLKDHIEGCEVSLANWLKTQECTRATCPDIFKGHSRGCVFYKD